MADLQPCGTPAAYKRHFAHDEKPCHACRFAMSQYNAAKRQRNHERMLAGEVTPEHGNPNTYATYRCRCGPCKDAHREESRASDERRREERRVYHREYNATKRRLRNRDGCWANLDPQPAIDHIRQLRSSTSASYEAIAHAGGIAAPHLRAILAGDAKPTWGTYQRILDTTVADVQARLEHHGRQPADVTRARAVYLADRAGFDWLRAHAGVDVSTLRRLLAGNQKQVKASTARNVRAAYDAFVAAQRKAAA